MDDEYEEEKPWGDDEADNDVSLPIILCRQLLTVVYVVFITLLGFCF